jgi:transposase
MQLFSPNQAESAFMACRVKQLDRNTPMLLPPDLREWVPDNHVVHFIIDAVDRLPESGFLFNHRGTGEDQYPPRMILALLIYCYATGRFSSRKIEEATYSDVIVRYICGGDLHPDHDTLCTFRRKNGELFNKAFVDVLLYAKETGVIKKVGTVSIDGTKINANASKHSAVSYKHAGEQIERLRNEVAELTAKAEQSDSTPLDDGLSIPEEIIRREDRIERLNEARRIIEERYAAERETKQSEYEQKVQNREEQRKNGKKPRGKEPVTPPENPPDKMQYNFTDPESRIMKAGSGDHFEQAYNAQAAVETGTLLIVGQLVTDAPNDKEQLNPVLDSIEEQVLEVENVLADTGYYSEAAVETAEADNGPTVYCAVEKTGHHRTVSDLERKAPPPPPAPDAKMKERMKNRLETKEGRDLYNQRKQTIEPVFGVIKEILGFRRFSMRGRRKAEIEWGLVCLSYNLKKLFTLKGGLRPEKARSRRKRSREEQVELIWAGICGLSRLFLAKDELFNKNVRVLSFKLLLTPTGC